MRDLQAAPVALKFCVQVSTLAYYVTFEFAPPLLIYTFLRHSTFLLRLFQFVYIAGLLIDKVCSSSSYLHWHKKCPLYSYAKKEYIETHSSLEFNSGTP